MVFACNMALLKENQIYTQAFAYLVAGYSLIPVGKDKRPLLHAWKKYQTIRPTEEELLAWWTKWPEANVGIITGSISGITVLDIDSYKSTNTVPFQTFPETFTVETGNKGLQLYYQYQPGLSISANAYPQFPNLDIRSDGGYVVAPPSVTAYDGKGGIYRVVNSTNPAPFPGHLFPTKKPKRTLTEKTTALAGRRNDTLASFIGTLLHSHNEDIWETEVYPAVMRANKLYTPPLSEKEVRATFESIVKKEKEYRSTLTISPIQINDEDGVATGEEVKIKIRKNGNGLAYKDMANVMAVLSTHPFYKDTIKYNEFRQEIEYNGKPIEDADLHKIQYFMQCDAALHGISKEAVHSAISHYAYKNRYDEAKDWLRSLTWDGTPRLATWLHISTGVEDDEYYQGIGAQWFLGIVRRIMHPGCVFDYMLVLVGPQGIGKTSFFRIIGGPWYKS